MRYDGEGGWRHEIGPGAEDLVAVDGTGEDNIWVMDASGRIHRFDDGRWTELPAHHAHTRDFRVFAPDDMPSEPTALHVAMSDDVWVALESGELWHWAGQCWERFLADTQGRVRAIAVKGGAEVWLAGLLDGCVATLARPHIQIGIESNRSDNRRAWGALAAVCERLARQVGGVAMAIG